MGSVGTRRAAKREVLEKTLNLIQKIGAIERVALLRNEARVANQAAQFLFGRLMIRASGAHHVLFDHDRAHVVPTKTQPELAGLESRSHPRGLNIQNILQI